MLTVVESTTVCTRYTYVSYVCCSRDVGKLYPGTVVEFNPVVKRHRVAFDDGDERWFRMERKIFTTDLNGEKVTYRGEMKLRRDAAVASTMSAEEAAANKPKPKPKKAKKIDKSIINRTYMTGTMATVGKKTVIEGWWDESRKVVQDPLKRDKQKTFKITKEREASLIPPHEDKSPTEKEKDDNADDDEEEEEDYFSGGNYIGWFKAMTATGGDSYDEFEDDLMLHMQLDEDEDSEEEGGKEGEEGYVVKGMGCNSGGTYRVSGTAVQGGVVNLLREYITEDYFEEEKAKFNKFVRGGDNGSSDRSMVELTLHDKLYLVSEVARETRRHPRASRFSVLSFLGGGSMRGDGGGNIPFVKKCQAMSVCVSITTSLLHSCIHVRATRTSRSSFYRPTLARLTRWCI